jgi:hypothetical protein
MLFCVTKRVMGFLRVVVTERAADAANKMLHGNREPEVRSRIYTFTIDSIRWSIQ